MAVTPITTSANRIAEDVFPVSYLSQSAIPEGAVCCYNTGGTDDEVILPGVANAGAIAGVSMSAGPLTAGVGGTSTAGTDRVVVQKLGRAKVLLLAGATVARGDVAVIANTLGHVQKRTLNGTTAGIVGVFAQSKTAGANAEFVWCDLTLGYTEICLHVFGAASTAPGAATKYLSAAGTTAGSASAVVLAVVPNAGVIKNLAASATTAPAGTDTGIFTVYRNPLVAGAYTGFAATTLTCTITGTAVEAVDTTHAPSVTQGDLLAIQCVSSNTTLAGLAASFVIA